MQTEEKNNLAETNDIESIKNQNKFKEKLVALFKNNKVSTVLILLLLVVFVWFSIKIYINEKKSDGTPYIDKNGNPFKMAVIENEKGDKASMYCGKFQAKDLEEIKTWKSGDTVRVNLEQDGKYINFSLPSKTDELSEKIASLELRICRLEGKEMAKAPEISEVKPKMTVEKEEITQEQLDAIPF